MTATEYLNGMKRMCSAYDDCYGCPMLDKITEIGEHRYITNCLGFQYGYPEKAEQAVEQWYSKNKVKTNADKFEEVFKKNSEWLGDEPWLKIEKWLTEPYEGDEQDE